MLHLFNKIFIILKGNIFPYISKKKKIGVLFMKHLKICPKCHSKLKLHSDGETQYCSTCEYWTKIGTVRLDSIMIYG